MIMDRKINLILFESLAAGLIRILGLTRFILFGLSKIGLCESASLA